jgi:hypothetical protein
MQKVTNYFILLSFIFCGLLLLYRSTLELNDLIKIEGKVLSRNTKIINDEKGRPRYILAIEIEKQDNKLGIYLGTKEQADNEKIVKLIFKDSAYTFFIDPTVSVNNGINLGIRQILYKEKILYKESKKANLIGGIIFTLLGLTGLFVIYNFKRHKNGS